MGGWRAKLRLPKRLPVCKFTLGTWAGVEKGKGREEIANRVLTADADRRVELTVERWASGAPAAAAAQRTHARGQLQVPPPSPPAA